MEQSQEALCFPRYKGLGARKGPEGAPGATAHPLCLPLSHLQPCALFGLIPRITLNNAEKK